MRIYTVTLNPAYDVHCTMPSLVTGKENLVAATERVAGGKGVNVSRALALFGVPNTAVVVMGEENDRAFRADLAAAGISYCAVPVPGRIRENYTFHPETGEETRVSFRGDPVPEGILARVAEALPVAAEDTVTFTGSIPRGVSVPAVTDFLRSLRERGARIVVDCGNYPTEEYARVRPYLIKPNEQEIAAIAGREIRTSQDALKAASFLTSDVENVMVSLGAAGAVLLRQDGAFSAVPPSICSRSTVGAGDSAVAGFLAAAAEGEAPDECLRRAVAFGTAACLRPGTLPPLPEDVDLLLPRVDVTAL